MGTPPRIFISTTSGDLGSVRKLVTEAVLKIGCHPVAQDHFSPEYRTVETMLREKIRTCQALIHIVGHRYGSEPDPAKLPPGTPRRSYTQMEYHIARELGIKTYLLVCPEGFDYDESDPEDEELRLLQESHREMILKGDWVYNPVEDRTAVSNTVQQFQVELDELRGTVERGRRSILVGLAALLLVLAAIGSGIFWMAGQSGKQSAALSEIQDKLEKDRKIMLAVLAKSREVQRDEPALTPAQRFEIAIRFVAETQSISEEEVRGSMELFAASVEVEEDAPAYDRALVAMGAQDFERATELARDAVKEAEASGNSRNRLAEAYSLLGDALFAALKFDEAAEAFGKAAGFVDVKKARKLWADLTSWAATAFETAGDTERADELRKSIEEQAAVEPDPGPAEKLVTSRIGNLTFRAPPSSPAGATFSFSVEGEMPANADYIAIARKDDPETRPVVRNYVTNVKRGGTFEISGPNEPGSYELRLMSVRQSGSRETLATVAIELTEVAVSVEAPESVAAGAYFEVNWEGPDGKGDFVTIVPRGAEAGQWRSHAYTSRGSPATLRAQDTAGAYEVRYLSGQGYKTLAADPIRVTPVTATLEAQPEAVGGATIPIRWTGPDHDGDFITVVPKDMEEGGFMHYDYTKNAREEPAEVRVPEDAGEHEIRYITGFEGRTLARIPLKVNQIVATVSAPEEVMAGAEVEVAWTGPAHRGDFVTIVEKGTRDNVYKDYFYPAKSEPVGKILAVETAGEAEIRYVTDGGKVVARESLRVLETSAKFIDPPATAEAGAKVQLKWEGPDNPKDLVIITKPEEEANRYIFYVYARNGQEKNELSIPEEPGVYEFRYVTGQVHNVLARSKVTVK